MFFKLNIKFWFKFFIYLKRGNKNLTNLTSTVKKLNPKKLDLHKKHLDNIINEQSAIQETEANNENTLNADDDDDDEYADNGNAAAAATTAAAIASSKKEERLKDEDYKCKIIYFYKNCSKVNILFLIIICKQN